MVWVQPLLRIVNNHQIQKNKYLLNVIDTNEDELLDEVKVALENPSNQS